MENNKYNNSKIYKIEPMCEYPEGDIYIGSTYEKQLSNRMAKHRSNYKHNRNKTMAFNLFDKYGVENCKIVLLEKVNVSTKEELLAIEGNYMKILKCVNRFIAGRTAKEYEKQYMSIPENRAKRNEYQKEYKRNTYEQNKEKFSEQRKETIICECGSCYRKYEGARHRRTATHKYFEEHNEPKPKLGIAGSRELQKQKVTCECGSVCGKGDLSKHKKTKKHLDYMQQKQTEN